MHMLVGTGAAAFVGTALLNTHAWTLGDVNQVAAGVATGHRHYLPYRRRIHTRRSKLPRWNRHYVRGDGYYWTSAFPLCSDTDVVGIP